MKKVLAMLLAILMLVCGVCMTVTAAPIDVENPDDSFNDAELEWGQVMGKFIVDNADAVVGKEFVLPIRIDNNPGIISVKLLVNYDTDVLELVSYEGGDFGSSEGQLPTLSFGNVESDTFYVNWVSALVEENVKDNGVLAYLTFRVKEDVQVESTEISVTYDPEDVHDFNLNNVEFTCTAGTVSITADSHIPGDINGDGEFGLSDITTLQRYYSGWDVEVDENALDVNGDGEFSLSDITTLQRAYSGWDVEIH